MTRRGVYFPRSRCPSCGSLAPLTIGKGGTQQPITDWVEIQCDACKAKDSQTPQGPSTAT